jgi:hypothetical protein
MGHRAAAIEVGEHHGGRIRIGHDHLRNQRGEDRQDVEREAQIFEPERGLVDHRPRTEKPPVQA